MPVYIVVLLTSVLLLLGRLSFVRENTKVVLFKVESSALIKGFLALEIYRYR